VKWWLPASICKYSMRKIYSSTKDKRHLIFFVINCENYEYKLKYKIRNIISLNLNFIWICTMCNTRNSFANLQYLLTFLRHALEIEKPMLKPNKLLNLIDVFSAWMFKHSNKLKVLKLLYIYYVIFIPPFNGWYRVQKNIHVWK
jgi:hypothetical protein